MKPIFEFQDLETKRHYAVYANGEVVVSTANPPNWLVGDEGVSEFNRSYQYFNNRPVAGLTRNRILPLLHLAQSGHVGNPAVLEEIGQYLKA